MQAAAVLDKEKREFIIAIISLLGDVMKETFFYAFRAIFPILLTIALGVLVRRTGKWDEKFFKALNQLSFHLFLPANLFCNIYGIGDLSLMNWPLMIYLVSGVFFCVFLGFLVAHFFIPRRDQKGVLVQASFRSNQAILGLPIAQALGGDAAMAFASLGISICVPIYNVLAVVILTWYSGEPDKKIEPKALLRKIFTNPLILACLLALAMVIGRQLLAGVTGEQIFFIRDRLPSVYQVLNNMAKIASPLMLFTLGTGLNFKATGSLLPQLALGVSLRLFVSPAIIIGGALLLKNILGMTALELPTLIAVTASPVAVSSAVMVQQMGGDDQLAGQLVVWSSVLSMLSNFLIIYALRSIGAL